MKAARRVQAELERPSLAHPVVARLKSSAAAGWRLPTPREGTFARPMSATPDSPAAAQPRGWGGPTERERSQARSSRSGADADDQAAAGGRARATLIAPERAGAYNSRWNELKGEFVDEPRGAVRGANELVGQVLDELEELFRQQRSALEQGLDSEQTSTEDLRLALGRYRSFFDRLLSF